MYKDVMELLLGKTVVMEYNESYESYHYCGVLSKENLRFFVRNNCDIVSFPHDCIQNISVPGYNSLGELTPVIQVTGYRCHIKE